MESNQCSELEDTYLKETRQAPPAMDRAGRPGLLLGLRPSLLAQPDLVINASRGHRSHSLSFCPLGGHILAPAFFVLKSVHICHEGGGEGRKRVLVWEPRAAQSNCNL